MGMFDEPEARGTGGLDPQKVGKVGSEVIKQVGVPGERSALAVECAGLQPGFRGMHFTPDYPTSCGWPVRLPHRCWTISE